MNKEQRDEIRKRCELMIAYVRNTYDNGIYDLIVNDIPALLDHIDELEKERDWLADHIAKNYWTEEYKADGSNNEYRIWLPTRAYWIAAAKAKDADLFLHQQGGIEYWHNRTIADAQKRR